VAAGFGRGAVSRLADDAPEPDLAMAKTTERLPPMHRLLSGASSGAVGEGRAVSSNQGRPDAHLSAEVTSKKRTGRSCAIPLLEFRHLCFSDQVIRNALHDHKGLHYRICKSESVSAPFSSLLKDTPP
jgi:hypothetical protein